MIGDPQEADTNIQWVANEKALLEAMIAWFSEFDPDIIIGWNVIDFDFRLLLKDFRMERSETQYWSRQSTELFRSSAQNQQGFVPFLTSGA